MAKILLFNGPLNCGKTYAVEHLKKFYSITDRRCKDKLFRLTMEVFSVPPRRFWYVYNNRSLKETPLPDFQLPPPAYGQLEAITKSFRAVKCVGGGVDISIREAMIYVSEVMCKPSFGKEYFGEARAQDIQAGELAADDSAGFVDELNPIIKKLGQENILLIRVKGRGSFDGDSRGFIPDGVIDNTVDVWNTGTLDEFLNEVERVTKEFLNA